MFKPAMREYLHTLYQFTEPWIVDDAKFRDAFGDHSTPLDDALASTVEWYRTAATPRHMKEHHDEQDPTSRGCACMASAAILAIAGFTALGSIFDYPKILKEPTDEILTAYRADQVAISGWFLVLVISAALLAPIGILLGRLAGGSAGRWIAGLGIAAAAVQVIGLSRWVVLVPHRRHRHVRAAAHLARRSGGRDHRLRADRRRSRSWSFGPSPRHGG